MPYIILIIGLIIGLVALYKFFLKADVQEIRALFSSVIVITICAALFVLSVTGRLPAAIAIISAIAPFALAWYNRRTQRNSPAAPSSNKPLDRKEALEILGLGEAAGADDIEAAYKRLMKKVHPDQEGSDWMAAKLNAARDFLLKNNPRLYCHTRQAPLKS